MRHTKRNAKTGRFESVGEYPQKIKTEKIDDAFLDAFELGVRATRDRKILSAAQCLKDWKKENL